MVNLYQKTVPKNKIPILGKCEVVGVLTLFLSVDVFAVLSSLDDVSFPLLVSS